MGFRLNRLLLRAAPALALALAAPAAETVPPDHAEKMTRGLALFEHGVRALLAEHCLECHGGKKVKGDFDLATREDLLRGGANGPAVRPFDAAGSDLLRMVRHELEPHMPDEKPRLPEELTDRLAAWIDLGAPYAAPLVEGRKPSRDKSVVTAEDKQWWAFQQLGGAAAALGRPPLPAGKAAPRTLDAFLLDAARGTGLGFAPRADKVALIRRASFDLTGLPPSPEEVEAFVNDTSPVAWERLVDRLLASPAHGERWARHWLDVARFAESSGFEHDYDREGAFHYRDFVIKALNADMPWDRFLSWQIAGDEFEPDNGLALSATGFLGAGVFPTQITANEVERTRYDAMDDMLSTTGSAFLGLTVGCARCHDHKYDPIPARDYYRLLSTFTTTVRSVVETELDPAEQDRRHAGWKREADALRARRDARGVELEREFPAWLAGRPAPPDRLAWRVLHPEALVSKAGATFRDLGDGSHLAEGTNGDHDTYTFDARVSGGPFTALRLEALAHPSMKAGGGPGRADNGNIGLSRLRVFATGPDGRTNEVRLARAFADFEQNKKNLSIASTLDEHANTGWAVDPQFGKDHAAVFVFDPPIAASGAVSVRVVMDFQLNTRHNIGRPRLALTADAEPSLQGDSLPAAVAEALAANAAGTAPTGAARDALFAWWRSRDKAWHDADAALAAHAKKEPSGKTKVLACVEGHKPVRMHTQGADFFKETHFLRRGDANLKDGVASQGFLQALMPDAEASARWAWKPPEGAAYSGRRRSLAHWLTDVEHGAGALTARVAVNRLWQHHFGRGLVPTPNDFGRTGDPPSHPELLDWLARRLVDGGWRLKPIHREMMLSEAYRQAVVSDAAREAADPDNRLFLRRTPARLEGEAIRDAMLAVSGLLDPTMHGPGTRDENSRRRSIYFTIKRSRLMGSMVSFDAPEPLVSQGSRPVTTVAPQALYLMNAPAVRGWAVAFAERARREAPDDVARIRQAYRLALGRPPRDGELEQARAFLAAQQASYQADAVKEPAQAAWTDFAQVLFGLNEFAYPP